MNHGFLLVPRPGERTTHSLLRKVRLLALRHLLTAEARSLRGAGLPKLQAVLARVARTDPAALLAAIGAADVLPLLLTSLAGLLPVEQTLSAAVPSLLAALGSLPEGVLWDRPFDAVTAGGRTWAFDPPALGMSVDPSGVTVRRADGTLERLVQESGTLLIGLGGGMHLALRDSFPLSMVEEHPDKLGNALDLGGRPVPDWVDGLNAGLALIEAGLPTWAEEARAIGARLVPVGFHPEMHLSASYREAPGVAWLTLHPDPLTLAEAIVHELQHGKLNLLSWLDPVLSNGRSVWTESPVRPDLRPLIGVLLAVHAFVPVAELHRRLAHRDWPDPRRFARRRAEVLASNARGLGILATLGEPTALGARLLGDLRALHEVALEAAGGAPVDPEAELLT